MDKVEALLDASHTLLAELLHLQVAGWTADLASVLRLSFYWGLAPAVLAISEPDSPESEQDIWVSVALRVPGFGGHVAAEVAAVLFVGHL